MLTEGVDYAVVDTDEFVEAGEYTILLEGIGDYTGAAFRQFTIINGILGDANLDGKVDITDATVIQRYDVKLIELSEAAQTLADVDKDGKVSIIDAT